jgi:hypothetical protein
VFGPETDQKQNLLQVTSRQLHILG